MTFQQQILRVKDKDYFPMIVVGNKCDLDGERQVSTQEGQNLARQFGCKFIETSAKSRINVDNAFYDIVREIRRYNKEMSAYQGTGSGNQQNGVSKMGVEDGGEGEIMTFQQQILRVKDKDYFPMIVVGNKCDLDGERQVSTQEGQNLARQFGCKFIETSAKSRINVDNAFYDIVRKIRRYNKEMSAYQGTGSGNQQNGVSKMGVEDGGEERS